jgi:hypothetical protein
LAQFDDGTVNLVATRDGVQGRLLDTKDRSIGSDWVRAKSSTLRRLLNFGRHPHLDFLALTTRFRNTLFYFLESPTVPWPPSAFTSTQRPPSATSRNIFYYFANPQGLANQAKLNRRTPFLLQ